MKSYILTAILLSTMFNAVSQTKPAIAAVPEEQQVFWNGFVDYITINGYSHSPELDRRDKTISFTMWNQYNNICHTHYDYKSFVIRVQQEMQIYREQSLALIHSGKAVFDGDDSDFMAGLSNPDGWAGSKTTSWKFPYVRSHTSVSIVNQVANVKR